MQTEEVMYNKSKEELGLINNKKSNKFWYIVAGVFIALLIVIIYINGMSIYDKNIFLRS